jgi:hypothetical protein
MKTWAYKGVTIELNLNGLYSAFIIGHGFVKADTLQGVKNLIRRTMDVVK